MIRSTQRSARARARWARFIKAVIASNANKSDAKKFREQLRKFVVVLVKLMTILAFAYFLACGSMQKIQKSTMPNLASDYGDETFADSYSDYEFDEAEPAPVPEADCRVEPKKQSKVVRETASSKTSKPASSKTSKPALGKPSKPARGKTSWSSKLHAARSKTSKTALRKPSKSSSKGSTQVATIPLEAEGNWCFIALLLFATMMI